MYRDRSDAVYTLLRQLRPIVLNSARVVEQHLRGVGWTVGDRAVVEVLVEHGPLPVPAIGHHLDLPRQAVQRHVDALLGLAHVETRHNPDHRRSVLITPTPNGRQAFDRIRAGESRDLEQLAAECHSRDLATATRVLAALDRDIRQRAATRTTTGGPA